MGLEQLRATKERERGKEKGKDKSDMKQEERRLWRFIRKLTTIIQAHRGRRHCLETKETEKKNKLKHETKKNTSGQTDSGGGGSDGSGTGNMFASKVRGITCSFIFPFLFYLCARAFLFFFFLFSFFLSGFV